MAILFVIIITTFLISLIAFIGVLPLFLNEKVLNKIILFLVSFAAGALLGSAFFHLIPEAISSVDSSQILTLFLFLIFGFCTFFILENFISWHHHHASQHPEIKPFSYLILVSDSIHNFIDGLIIAASFLINFTLGIVTTLAVALHEVPQEIGDFGVLIYSGFEKKKALFFNFLSAFTVVFGGIVGYFLANWLQNSLLFFLPFAAGSFIYIASSDLIPEIKTKIDSKKSLIHFLFFLFGIELMLLMKIYYNH